MAYLQYFKVNNLGYVAAQHTVCTVICSVAHGVEPIISTPRYIGHSFDFLQHPISVCFPVFEDYWEKELLLMVEEGSCGVHCHTHVLE